MGLKCAPGIQAEGGQIEVDPAGLFMKRVQIAEDDDDVGKIVRRLAIADDCGIVGRMKTQIGVTLQGKILAANAVDAGDKILQAPRALRDPNASARTSRNRGTLRFGPAQYFRSARMPGHRFHSLPHRGGKNEAGHKRRPASESAGTRAGCRACSARGSAESIRALRFRQVLKIVCQLRLGVTPREISIRLRKPPWRART